MWREQTLLDRIAASSGKSAGRYERTAQEDPDALIESVRRHLTRLLNARHEMSEALPEYGLPALTDVIIGTKDYVEIVRDAIRVAIEKFEPRLRRVRVMRINEDAASGHILSFRVEAMLVGRVVEYRVAYDTLLTGSGAIDVS
ncbi:MAG TPA: type VI secretion system baseplate subunit TssE [Phycisphaerae bacterium]|jgi:type VI secretion system protein